MSPLQLSPRFGSTILLRSDWWYESWGLQEWLQTLFNQPLEVHTFLLGMFIGVVLATLTVSHHPRTALTFTLVVVLFTFGAFETVFVCSGEFSACQHVRLKPWYFIAGFLSAHVGTIATIRRTTRYSAADDVGTPTTAAWVAGLVVFALLGFALYSFVSPTPVHPITGLATVGGVLGSVLGLTAYRWASAIDEPRFTKAMHRTLWADRAGSSLIIGYGTVAGFGYPRLFWELGNLVGRETFLFGDLIWARNGLPSVVTYVFVLFLLGLLLQWIRVRGRDDLRIDGQRFAAIVLGFATYTFCLFILTGYAGLLWFKLIPSAPA